MMCSHTVAESTRTRLSLIRLLVNNRFPQNDYQFCWKNSFNIRNSTGFQCTGELCSGLWCWCRILSKLCVPVSSASGYQHFRCSSMCYCKFPVLEPSSAGGTVTVEQSFCCCIETERPAYFQATTECLSVPHLMCRQTGGTFTTAQSCCGICVITAPATKLLTYLLFV